MCDVIEINAMTGDRIERGYSDEELAHIAERSPSINQRWIEYQEKAQALLDATDAVCLRCYKASVPYPTEWLDYTNSLRCIVRSPLGDPAAEFPLRPEYPAGT